MTRSDVAALRAKYEEMLRLREAHDAHEGRDEPDPRRAMAALASRFPGALREIDDLPLADIRARIAALRAAEESTELAGVAPWMEATHLFHALTRGALCAKKWLADRGHRTAASVDDGVRAAFERESGALCYPSDAVAWTSDLAHIAAPPRGRVTDLVYVRMAVLLAVSTDDARLLVFGRNRRERRDDRS